MVNKVSPLQSMALPFQNGIEFIIYNQITMKNLQSALFLFVILNFTLGSCSRINCISGDGNQITKTIELDELHGIELSMASEVNILQGAEQKIELIGDENIINELQTELTEGIWKIQPQAGCYSDYTLKINITMATLDEITINGSGKVVVGNFSDQSDLSVIISGSGNTTLNQFEGLTNFIGKINGSGEITAKTIITPIDYLDVNISGSGQFTGYPMQGRKCDISISGSGGCQVYAIDELHARISGSGRVTYKGSPEVDEKVSGSGSIQKAN